MSPPPTTSSRLAAQRTGLTDDRLRLVARRPGAHPRRGQHLARVHAVRPRTHSRRRHQGPGPATAGPRLHPDPPRGARHARRAAAVRARHAPHRHHGDQLPARPGPEHADRCSTGSACTPCRRPPPTTLRTDPRCLALLEEQRKMVEARQAGQDPAAALGGRRRSHRGHVHSQPGLQGPVVGLVPRDVAVLRIGCSTRPT